MCVNEYRSRRGHSHTTTQGGHLTTQSCNHIHHRDEGSTLQYEGHYSAPGIGISTTCVICQQPFSVIGDSVYHASEMAHILDPEDCI